LQLPPIEKINEPAKLLVFFFTSYWAAYLYLC